MARLLVGWEGWGVVWSLARAVGAGSCALVRPRNRRLTPCLPAPFNLPADPSSPPPTAG